MNRVKHRKSKSLGLIFGTCIDLTNIPLLSKDIPLSHEEFLWILLDMTQNSNGLIRNLNSCNTKIWQMN
jgi:hypothetical protein